jgi:hypothetical protein
MEEAGRWPFRSVLPIRMRAQLPQNVFVGYQKDIGQRIRDFKECRRDPI